MLIGLESAEEEFDLG